MVSDSTCFAGAQWAGGWLLVDSKKLQRINLVCPLGDVILGNTETNLGKKTIMIKSTPLKFNMEPEKKSLEKEIPFGNHRFQVPC